MKRLEFYYQKTPYFLQLIVSIFFLVFVGYFAYLIYDFFASEGPENDQALLILRSFFIGILSLFILVSLFLLVRAARIVLVRGPAISMDKETIEIEGRHEFAWSDIDYIQYIKRRTTRQTSGGIRGKSTYYLYLKPHHGRKLKVDITHIDEQNHEIFASIHKLAPKLNIKGWKK